MMGVLGARMLTVLSSGRGPPIVDGDNKRYFRLMFLNFALHRDWPIRKVKSSIEQIELSFSLLSSYFSHTSEANHKLFVMEGL